MLPGQPYHAFHGCNAGPDDIPSGGLGVRPNQPLSRSYNISQQERVKSCGSGTFVVGRVHDSYSGAV